MLVSEALGPDKQFPSRKDLHNSELSRQIAYIIIVFFAYAQDLPDMIAVIAQVAKTTSALSAAQGVILREVPPAHQAAILVLLPLFETS
jgi:hypothetical protein